MQSREGEASKTKHDYNDLRARRSCRFERIRVWGHNFLGIEALYRLFGVRPAYRGQLERTVFIHSDRPVLYENQSDLPRNPHSLEKTQGRGSSRWSRKDLYAP